MKIDTILKKVTKAPLEVVCGKGVCFHEGNTCSIVKRTEDGGEIIEETVAEIWPAEKKIDYYDTHLLCHSYNNFSKMLNNMRETRDAIKSGNVLSIRFALTQLDKCIKEVENIKIKR